MLKTWHSFTTVSAAQLRQAGSPWAEFLQDMLDVIAPILDGGPQS